MKLSKNGFIEKHGTGIGLAGQLERFFPPAKLVEDRDGKDVPSPHMIIKKFVEKIATGDWAVWTEGSGRLKVTCVLFADKKDALKFQKSFKLVHLPQHKHPAFKSAYRFQTTLEQYLKLAVAFGFKAPFSQKKGNRRVALKAIR